MNFEKKQIEDGLLDFETDKQEEKVKVAINFFSSRDGIGDLQGLDVEKIKEYTNTVETFFKGEWSKIPAKDVEDVTVKAGMKAFGLDSKDDVKFVSPGNVTIWDDRTEELSNGIYSVLPNGTKCPHWGSGY